MRGGPLDEARGAAAALTGRIEQVPPMVSAVKAIRRRSPIAPTLLDALGSSGTSESHRTLAALAKSKELDAKLRNRALTA